MNTLTFAEAALLRELSRRTREEPDGKIQVLCTELDKSLHFLAGESQGTLLQLRDHGKITISVGTGAGLYQLRVVEPIPEISFKRQL